MNELVNQARDFVRRRPGLLIGSHAANGSLKWAAIRQIFGRRHGETAFMGKGRPMIARLNKHSPDAEATYFEPQSFR